MSNLQLDSDGFQIVSSKKSFKNKSTKVPKKPADFLHSESYNIDIEKSYEKILSVVDVLKDSQYYKDVIKSVSSITQDKEFVELVCFGLGHIGECNISRYQLALVLCFKNVFKIANVLVHDPIFSSQDCELIKRFKLTIIKKNKEGGYVILNTGKTIVYLPHCPKQLTNNFLWSNWGINLENCILICNSFTSLLENQLTRVLSESVPYIQKIFSYITEVSLENNFIYKDIFNDTSIHYFPNEKLKLAPVEFWLNREKPKYKDTEEFITSLMIEKLNIV